MRKSDERLAALERHFADTLASLDDQVRALSLGRFVGEFGADPNAALRVLVEEKMRPPPISQVEQSARKRCVASASLTISRERALTLPNLQETRAARLTSRYS